MKTIQTIYGVIVSILFVTQLVAGELPSGFDEATLKAVLSGKIVTQTKIDTETEYRQVNRAFFDGVSTDSFLRAVVNHANYVSLFEEVEDARTTSINKENTAFGYALDLKVTLSYISFFIHATGVHQVQWAADTKSEAWLHNTLTSHKENVEFLTQTTQLIPYEGGILIEEELHLKIKKEGTKAKLFKNYLRKFFSSYLDTFREAL